MRKSRNNILLICYLLTYILVYGQVEKFDLPKVIPPSPDAYQFTMYGNIPNNGSTGGFSYSIPVFSLKNGDLSTSVSLDYYSNGVQVDALSTMVGMGWSLNAGGVISRVVRDEPDEKTQYRWYPSSINSNDYNLVKSAAANDENIDTERDWFSFKVNNLNGKFYHDKDLNIIVESDDYVKIKKLSNGFEITDSRGFEYVFGGSDNYIESNFSFNTCSHIKDRYTSAWYLKKIISPNGKELSFQYEKIGEYYATAISNNLTLDQSCDCSSTGKSFNINHQKCVSYNQQQVPVIKEIISGESKILFSYSHGRKDMISGGVYLSSIGVYNDSGIVSSYGFIYEYTVSPNHKDNKLINDDSLKYRLFLKSVVKNDKNFNETQDYVFEYLEKDKLPCRLSYDKDVYGFYNAKSNLKPFSYPKDSKSYAIMNRYVPYLMGADQDPNPLTVEYGILKKVFYPSGGMTEIDYEINSDIKLEEKGTYMNHHIYLDKGCNDVPSKSESFVFVSNGTPLNFSAGASIDTYICNSEPDALHDQFGVSIRDLTTGVTLKSFNMDAGNYVKTDELLDCSSNSHIEKIPICTVEGHQYEVTFRIDSKFSQISGSINLKYNRSNDLVEKLKHFGGVRVKSIHDVSKQHEYNKREFWYTSLNTIKSQNSSLQELNVVKYSSNFSYFKNCICNSGGYEPYQVSGKYERYYLSSGTLQSLYNNRNNSIYYTNITEILTSSNSTNGAIEKYFHPIYNSKASVITPPFIPNVPSSNNDEVYHGVQDSLIYYKSNGHNFEREKKHSYYYSIREINKLPSMVFNKNYDYTNIPVPDEKIDNISIVKYINFLRKKRIHKIVEMDYLSSGNLIKTEVSYYDSEPYFNLKEKIYSSSKVDLLNKVVYYYPYNKTEIDDLIQGESKALDKLVTNYRISEPIQTETVIKDADGKLLSKKVQRTTYKDWGNNIILPEKVLTSKGSGALESRLEYKRYDSHGNPTELKQTNGATIVYLWGYNGQYPVAKIENSSYTAVINTGVNLSVLTSVTSSESSKLSELNKIRNHSSMSNAQVTTYTYDPLVGVSTITGPRGVKTSYDYDSFNRLEFIKDETGKLLEHYKYHYKN